MRVENQPYGRLHGDHLRPGVHGASRTSTRRSAAWRISRRRRSTTCATSSGPTTCPTNATLVDRRRLRPEAGARSWSTQYLGRVPKADAAGAARHSGGAAADARSAASRVEESWPLPAVVVAYHITYDGHPDSYPLHIASKILSDGQSSRIYRKLVYEKRHRAGGVRRRQHHRGPEPVLRGRDRAAGPDAGRGRARRSSPSSIGCEASRSATRELQRAKNQFARDYIVGRESNQDKAAQLAHAAVIHNDIKTADGEFDIFLNITAADVQRVAQDLLHAGEPARDHDHAARSGGASDAAVRDAACPRRWSSALVGAAACVARAVPAGAQVEGLADRDARRGRCRRATSSSRRTRSARWPTACR